MDGSNDDVSHTPSLIDVVFESILLGAPRTSPVSIFKDGRHPNLDFARPSFQKCWQVDVDPL